MTYDELRQAVTVFDLPCRVTLKGIRERHRQLVKKYHPDTGADPDNNRIRQVNSAYRILEEYVGDYNFDFSRETFFEQYPEERLRDQFYSSELWSRKD